MTQVDARPSRGNPKGPAVVYSALAVGLVVLVASLAFSARQPPPPQIAELTPQAQHQITRAPNQLTSNLGAAAGSGGGAETASTVPPATLPNGQPVPTTSASPAIDVPAVHQCYGNPPRQISFDTQSPPCVAYWAGNNGGATSFGVTANQITVLASNPNGNDSRVVSDLQAFFNRTFEFYGRQLRLIAIQPRSNYSCSSRQADALGAATNWHPFAATEPGSNSSSCYLAEMVRLHIVTTTYIPYFDTATLAQQAPYLWEYPMTPNDQFSATGNFICAQLAGKDASFSPDPVTAGSIRKFGLIIQHDTTAYSGQYNPAPLSAALSRCGQSLAAEDTITYQEGNSDQQFASDSAQVAAQSRQAILDMQQHGVTTVVCYCDDFMEQDLPPAADAQDYHPEWVLEYANDWNAMVDEFWPNGDQREALMGLTFQPAQVPYPDTTLNQAIATVDPGYQVSENAGALTYLSDQYLYWELLQIASGIQMAGPDLTPASFQRGLQLAAFPNPYSPEEEGVAGFAGASHAMTTDAAVMWWDNTAPSPYPDEGTGTWCYVDAGRRFGISSWPSTPLPLFKSPCDNSPVSSVP